MRHADHRGTVTRSQTLPVFTLPFWGGITIRYGCSFYRGALVVWDEDFDTRVLDFLDELPDDVRLHLFAVSEHEGTLGLAWKSTPPRGFHRIESHDVCGDVWSLGECIWITGFEDEEVSAP